MMVIFVCAITTSTAYQRAPSCVHAVYAAHYVAIPPHVVEQTLQVCEDNDQEETTRVEATKAPSYFDARWAEG